MAKVIKKIFKHGGSYAVHIPVDFVRKNHLKEVVLDYNAHNISIHPKASSDDLVQMEQIVFNKYSSGKGDLSVNHKKYHKESIDEKYRRH